MVPGPFHSESKVTNVFLHTLFEQGYCWCSGLLFPQFLAKGLDCLLNGNVGELGSFVEVFGFLVAEIKMAAAANPKIFTVLLISCFSGTREM
jgi:hypothetical protein